MTKRGTWIAAVAAALCVSPAWADNKDQARTHYNEGRKLYDLGKFQEAAAAFEKGYELHADPVFLFNLGQCFRQIGNTDRALFFYRGFLRNKPDTPNRAQVEQLIQDLEKARETSTQPPVEAMPPSGQEAEPAPAKEPVRETSPAPAAAATQTDAEVRMPTEAPPPSTQKWLAWGTVGLGAALIGVGAVFGMQAKSAEDDVSNATEWNSDLQDKYDSGESKAKMATIFIGIGSAAVVGGGIWAYFAHKQSASPTAGLDVDVSDGVRVVYEGSF